ncbi:MAG: GNAT family N-acetyltransferase [Oscillospiraceae bacterium]|nr:GNAT family N-acetyltransferase [Oscillospiraceae bacterium]
MFTFTDQFDRITSGPMTLQITEKVPAGPDGLPFYFYDILVNGQPVGKISIRIGATFHTYYNGNIGYEIDEPYRGHGCARAACRMILPVARHHGMTSLYLTCAEGNIASYRTIEGLGSELLEICEVPREYFAWREGMERQRVYRLPI